MKCGTLLAILASASLIPLATNARAEMRPLTVDANVSKRVDALLDKMTLDEKFQLLTSYWAVGVKGHPVPPGAIGSAGFTPANARLGIPALQETDAGLGVTNPGDGRKNPGDGRGNDGATGLPGGQAISGTFDSSLAYEAGRMIGTEAAHRGFNVLLAGGVNLVRDPRGGRNFEYAGEDPILAGETAAAIVKGVQSAHVISTVKHYAANSMETARTQLNSILDEQPMRESDLLAFEIAIGKGDPGSVMCGYNAVNGVHDCDDPYLLRDVLRTAWHYNGYVMSDWGGVYDGDAAFAAGLDQQSGLPLDGKVWFGKYMQDKVVAGKIPVSKVDEKVRHILYPVIAHGLMDKHPRPTETDADVAAHIAIAQRVEEAGAVLLKNDHDVLPFGPGVRNILVVGGNADKGVIAGGGSGAVLGREGSPVPDSAPITSSQMHWPCLYFRGAPVDALRMEMPKAKIAYLDGHDLSAVKNAAKHADRVIVFATKWSVEGTDNADMKLDAADNNLITAAASQNPRTVVVLETGNPVEMPWRHNVSGILQAWYPGSGGAKAIARLLAGAANPSGRLSVTWPKSLSQLPRPEVKGLGLTIEAGDKTDPALYSKTLNLNIEGADVGYRWFSLKGETPLYPFGYGLSYTRFGHDGLTIDNGRDGLQAHTVLKNLGARIGADVVQVYVKLPDGSPERLAGYLRVELKPDETKEVTIPLSNYALARFDTHNKRWMRRAGDYAFRIATDSMDTSGPKTSVHLNKK